MIEFEKAIEVAMSKARSLLENASNFLLEGVLLSKDGDLFEVSLSYDTNGKDPLGGSQGERSGGLAQLAQLMRYRREYKIFLIDSRSGQFRGFKNQNDR